MFIHCRHAIFYPEIPTFYLLKKEDEANKYYWFNITNKFKTPRFNWHKEDSEKHKWFSDRIILK